MARLKKTVVLREIAPDVLGKADKKGRRYGAMAVNAWPVVVGEEIARHTRGFALREDHELVVFVDGPAWANQLSLMADDIQQRINAHLGQNAVKSLRFTVSRAVAQQGAVQAAEEDAGTYYLPEPQTPAALDGVELEQARHVAAAVRDPGLRELALKVMVKDLEQKKGARISRGSKGLERPPREA